MELRPGEKASGVIREVKDDGFIVELRNDIKGFANRNCKEGVDPSEVKKGTEVKVVVEERSDDALQLSIIELFSQDKYLNKPDKYLKNVSSQRNNSHEEPDEEVVSDELEEWFEQADEVLEEVKENRKQRLDKDFWVP